MNAVFDELFPNVDQQPEPKAAKAQVGEDLLVMHRSKRFKRLDLDYYTVLDDKISAKACLELHPFVDNGKGMLTHKGKAPLCHLPAECFFVNRFEQTGAGLAMNLEACVHDLLCDNILLHHTDTLAATSLRLCVRRKVVIISTAMVVKDR